MTPTPSHAGGRLPAPDVVGVGALNLDYVATAAHQARDDHRGVADRAGLSATGGSPVDWGSESVVDAATMRAVLGRIDLGSLESAPGGSAFNAVHALARMDRGLHLGYVGVSGVSLDGGPAAHEQLDRLGVDRTWVDIDQAGFGGVCLSVMRQGERTLFVHPGANTRMAAHLTGSGAALTDYLASSRVVHVTSFLDSATPAALGSVLAAARRRRPGLTVVVDPGHVWCAQRTPDIDLILACGDYVLLNDREFRELAGADPSTGSADHLAAAERILRRLQSPAATVIHKRADAVWVFRRGSSGPAAHECRHERIAAEEIADSTGAGDVFASGLLAALAIGHDVLTGVRLGAALARTAIRHVGAAGHRHFAGIADDVVGGGGVAQVVDRPAAEASVALPGG